MYRAGDVRIENVADAAIVHPTDAVIRTTRAWIAEAICGLEPTENGRRMGHEARRTRYLSAMNEREAIKVMVKPSRPDNPTPSANKKR